MKKQNLPSPLRTLSKSGNSGTVFPSNPLKGNKIAVLLLVLLSIALYINTIGFEFVLDDKIVISENQYVKKGFAGISEILSTESFSGYFGEHRDLVVGARYRPLSIVSFAIEHQFFGLNPKISHLINVLLYSLTAVLLFVVLSLFFPPKEGADTILSIAFIGTLLFILHPLHTEVVANIKGRDEILCLMAAMGSLYLMWQYLHRDQLIYLFSSLACFFLALLAKENALTFIAIIPLSIYYFSNVSTRKNLLAAAGLVAVAGLYLLLRYQVIGYFLSSGKEVTDIMNNPFYGLTYSEKYGTIFDTLGRYLKLLVIPHPLTHDYYPYHIPVSRLADWHVILSLLLHIGLVVFALITFRKKSVTGYGILFYLISLSIVSNIPFTVGTFMNERFLFIPSIGFCLIMAYLIAEKIPGWTSGGKGEVNILSTGLLFLFIAGFGFKTISRVPDWKSRMSLNKADVEVSVNSARANCFMATALYEQYLEETDKKKKKVLLKDINYYLERSLKILPLYGSALIMKSGVVAENYQQNRDLDKLLDEFFKLIQINPRQHFIDEYLVYLNNSQADRSKLARFYFRTGAWFANEARSHKLALKYLEQYGLGMDPENPDLRRAVGQVYQKINQPEKAALYLD